MVQATCTFIPVVLRFPEYSSGCALHDQAREQCAVHDVACSGVEFTGRRDVVGKRLYQQRGDCRDSAADRGLRDAVVLGYSSLDPVPAQIRQGYGERVVQAEDRRQRRMPGLISRASIFSHSFAILARYTSTTEG